MVLTVAVTGPTGEIGRPLIEALEGSPEVGRIIGMARRSFEPAAHGWKKVEYRRGDVLNRRDVDALVAAVDVVVHLAFVIVAGQGRSREVNLVGSRNVFEATAAAGARRLIYTSSVAAYGFDSSLPDLLSEDVETAGTQRHPYSAQKAEVEALLVETLAGSEIDSYVFRPCIVAGPKAQLLIDSIPLSGLTRRLPQALAAVIDHLPLAPVLPDPGVRFQLVHHDDVAAALCAAVLGNGDPGVYNLAAAGEITVSDLAHALGWHSIPTPRSGVSVAAEIIARVPFLPNRASWIEALRRSVLMDTARARVQLGWQPSYDALETLQAMCSAYRKQAS